MTEEIVLPVVVLCVVPVVAVVDVVLGVVCDVAVVTVPDVVVAVVAVVVVCVGVVAVVPVKKLPAFSSLLVCFHLNFTPLNRHIFSKMWNASRELSTCE